MFFFIYSFLISLKNNIILNLLKVMCFAQVAQSVEQRTENPCVVGSIPTLGTLKK